MVHVSTGSRFRVHVSPGGETDSESVDVSHTALECCDFEGPGRLRSRSIYVPSRRDACQLHPSHVISNLEVAQQ